MTTNHRTTRRSFLKTTAALTAAAPFILPSRIWSAEVKPNDRLALGFIGMGTQGKGLMGGFLGKKETQTVAVCDVDTNRREDAKKRVEEFYAKQSNTDYKGCAAYADFRALLVRKDIDAVVIATPDHWHAYLAIAAANASKDIYCEKPLCESIQEARAMVKAVRKNKRVFQTGSMQRSSKEFRIACELVRNGRIGKISRVEVAVGVPGIPCDLPTEADEPGLDWDMWLGPAPMRGYHSKLSPRGVHKHFPGWRDYREYGGGMVTDWGAHHFDIAQWGLGMDDSGPTEIIPASDRKATQGARLIYANGVEVNHVNSGFGVVFHGSEGVVKVNRGKFEFWLGDQQKAKATADCDAVAKEYLANAKVRLYESKSHQADFLTAIQTRQKPICDVEIGARTVSVCHLVNLPWREDEMESEEREVHGRHGPEGVAECAASGPVAGGLKPSSWLTITYSSLRNSAAVPVCVDRLPPHPSPFPWPERCSWDGERARLGRSRPRPRGLRKPSDQPHRLVWSNALVFGARARRTAAEAAALPILNN